MAASDASDRAERQAAADAWRDEQAHEYWDGTGYPQGLKGDAMPLTGRIVAIVDIFDALTHMRPYRKSWPTEQALAELQRCAGARFDPWCVDVFLTLRADALACSLLGLPPKVNR